MKKRTLAILVAAIGMVAVAVCVQAQLLQSPTQPLKTPYTTTPTVPNVTSWGPQGKIAAGERIWFIGTNLNPSTFIATLGDRGFPTYRELRPIASSTSTRIEVLVEVNMVTGPAYGLPLRVLNSGGTSKQLSASYYVIDRNAHYSGTSQYQIGNAKGGSIFTTGTVQIVLNNVDFANEGSGTYAEQVRLVHNTSTIVNCVGPLVGKLYQKTIYNAEWGNWSVSRPVTWKRSSVDPNSITITDIGSSCNFSNDKCLKVTVNAQLTSAGLASEYITYTQYSPDAKSESACTLVVGINEMPQLVMAGEQWAQLLPVSPPPPLQPAPPAYVIMLLKRTD